MGNVLGCGWDRAGASAGLGRGAAEEETNTRLMCKSTSKIIPMLSMGFSVGGNVAFNSSSCIFAAICVNYLNNLKLYQFLCSNFVWIPQLW